ncbi:hypothetical protein Syun_022714 [Stephania yunnanensis]|uniref:Uncharacterized protein n=1 Tax=Stephania yunnanensis TaxID=152371 RepID=A0AAP0FJV3_9MAGN
MPEMLLRLERINEVIEDNLVILGANAILVVSITVCKAGASVKKVPLYKGAPTNHVADFKQDESDSDSDKQQKSVLNIQNAHFIRDDFFTPMSILVLVTSNPHFVRDAFTYSLYAQGATLLSWMRAIIMILDVVDGGVEVVEFYRGFAEFYRGFSLNFRRDLCLSLTDKKIELGGYLT